MSALAEDQRYVPGSARNRLRAVALVLIGLAAVGALGYGLKSLVSDTPAGPKRQVARIAILPDTPPPPPPPPKEEKRPEPPKAEAKPVPQEQQPKPALAPAAQDAPIRMEGAAGSGDSPFAAGPVTSDYSGGTPVTAPAASASAAPPPPSAADRAQERLYAGSARALLRDELERHLQGDAEQATATFSLWVEPDGAIRRVELQRTGDAELDRQIDSALDQTARSLKLPPPPAISQPMKFRITLRPQG